MSRFRIDMEYDGSRYAGWQLQKNAISIQNIIHKAIKDFFQTEHFEFLAASRTDTGVHALRQTAHLDLTTNLSAAAISQAINLRLPSDIYWLSVELQNDRFHARELVVSRSYVYQISLRRSVFNRKYSWLVANPLNIDKMRQAVSLFLGMKDFASFAKIKDESKSTKVLLEQIEIRQTGAILLIRIKGSHFLWRMIRRLIGVLVAVGANNLPIEAITDFFSVRSEIPAKFTAPAHGLFLEKIYYSPQDSIPELLPCQFSSVL